MQGFLAKYKFAPKRKQSVISHSFIKAIPLRAHLLTQLVIVDADLSGLGNEEDITFLNALTVLDCSFGKSFVWLLRQSAGDYQLRHFRCNNTHHGAPLPKMLAENGAALHNLESLSLSGLYALNLNQLSRIMTSMSSLRTLDIRCNDILDSRAASVLRETRLVNLLLGSCSEVDDQFIERLTTKPSPVAETLQWLDVCGTRISDASLPVFEGALMTLTCLDLRKNGLPEAALSAFSDNVCHRMLILSVPQQRSASISGTGSDRLVDWWLSPLERQAASAAWRRKERRREQPMEVESWGQDK
jgi:hypothetical protein